MRQMDLNADLGELADASLDAAVMPLISSANIACGGHAGDEESIRRTIRLARQHNVAIGAHPGYPDRINFGRTSLDMPVEDLCVAVREQVGRCIRIARDEGVAVRHVKLHGALYNDLIDNYADSYALCCMLAELDPGLRVIGFSNSAFLRAAEDAGLVAVHEVFADRAYDADGRLLSRSQPGAVLHDESLCLAQVEMMVMQGRVPTTDERLLPIQADSVCVHGDNPSAVVFVETLSRFFRRQDIAVRPSGDLTFSFAPLGSSAMLAKLPSRIARSSHQRIRALQHRLSMERIPSIREYVPCYSELKIEYDPDVIRYDELCEHIGKLTVQLDPTALPPTRLIEIPVCYEGDYAPDLEFAARHTGLTIDEIVRRHSEPRYLVYMLGFSPGFAYLGGLDLRLAMPRMAIPRLSVPAGAVGIAGQQTGVYPMESPGGWQIIGRTAARLFDPDSSSPFLLEPGDEVRFVPITIEEFESQ